ncbi:NAD-dependent epimerase/dehydratase family protein [Stackebrandtia nassauensis]|uniref:NAD-dependent epimerase/dehydratase n=1 Tax=Stackebrandtia nassauensis (strain DSM 44728 / CIP 108903 / NRRL B-16338 / NBRC 102104 / LLR-40K-21) TaxID=446470 RepID=D3Q3G0_STANL|nr:NAD-dependent epimerase/dehydratase family protein [Stackebrandtia nassauensis]ADD42001.1 NAD-dependent epimerase/dehydratase [Stackebrandtia nassauensis DSM 44728]
MAKHVIAGAGQVGSQLALALAERGHEVILVSRSGSGPETVTRVAADVADADRLAELCEGAVALYNCVNPAYHRWLTDWPPMAAGMLAAAERSGAVYVMLGNLYVYAEPTAPMRETDPLAPTSAKAEVRAQMWRDALAAHEAGRIRATEVRASDYYGPSCKDQSHLGERFMPLLLAGKTVQFAGDPSQPHSWTYVPDVVQALITAAEDERAWGKAWHVPTAPPRTARELAADVCRLEGIPNPGVKAIPGLLLSVGGLFSPMIRELRHVRYQFIRPFVVDSSAFETTFGVAPTDMDEALKATVAAWRES